MLAAVRTVALSRFAAVAVAVALSGAPRLAAAHPRTEHRCACPAHALQRDCSCGTCRSAHAAGGDKHASCARHAGKAQGPQAPPQPRVVGSCGMPEAPPPPPSGVDLFTLPAPEAIALTERAEPVLLPRAVPPPSAREPETPPPRFPA